MPMPDVTPLSVFVADPEQVRLLVVPAYAGLALLYNVVAYLEHLTKSPQGYSLRKARQTIYIGILVGLFGAILDPALLSNPIVGALLGLSIPILDEVFGTLGNLRKQVEYNEPPWTGGWFK